MNESVSLGLRRAQEEHWLQMITVKYELINCGGIAIPFLHHPHEQKIELKSEQGFTFPSTEQLLHSQVPAFKDHLSSCSTERRKCIKPMFIETGAGSERVGRKCLVCSENRHSATVKQPRSGAV